MLNWKLGLFLATLTLGGCKCCPMHHGSEAAAPAAGTAASSEVSYTCPMHPQVVKPAPGKCDICGMDLVAKK